MMMKTRIIILCVTWIQLTNYGITRNQYEDLDRYPQTRVLKTFEYLAPEYEQTGTDSSKSDVYSFGVVLLELITGRKSIQETNGRSFLRWVINTTTYPSLASKLCKFHHVIFMFLTGETTFKRQMLC